MRALICERALLVSACILCGAAGWAQQGQKSVQPASDSTDLAVTFASERLKPDPSSCCFWLKGGGAEVAATFWKGFGIATTLTGDHAAKVFSGKDENKISFLAGPRYTLTAWKGHTSVEDPRQLQLFGQGLIGGAHGFESSYTNGSTSANALAIQTGGGLNFYLTKKFGIRMIEADFVRTRLGTDGLNTQNDMRLSAGVLYHFDAILTLQTGYPPPPVTLFCSVSPPWVFPGDPVTVVATAGALDPKLNAVYSWSGLGVSGNGTTVSIATGSLAPGSYTVKGLVNEGKPGKQGWKPGQTADCSASFMVRAFEPPTISCTAAPPHHQAG